MSLFRREPERNDEGDYVPAPYRQARGLTAAATRVNIKDKNEVNSLKKRRSAGDWQENAWEYFDLIGEVAQAATLVANVTSRIRLYVGCITDDDLAPAHAQDVEHISPELKAATKAAMTMLATGNGGIAGLLQDAALNLFIAGECYLIQQPARPGSHIPETWQIRSVDEIVATTSGKNSSVSLRTRRTDQPADYIKLPPNSFMGRIWRVHPRFSDEATSSMRSLLELCEELLLLNKVSRKNAKSSLNAGILYLPDDLSNVSQSDGELDDDTETMASLSNDESDSFEEELLAAMTTPISDEDSASSVVPLIIRGPADVSEAIRHFTMDRPFDVQQNARADRILERILVSLDLPIDVIKGMSSVKYSNAVIIEEQLYKAHIEPLILLIVDSLTVVFLRPVLRAYGFSEEEISHLVIWYDPSAITSRPSKAEAATEGYQMQTINAKAWRRAHGFAESDAPTELEIGQRLAIDRGLLSEEVTEALLRTLIPGLLQQVRQEQLEASPDAAVVERALDADSIPQPHAQTEAQDTEGPRPPVDLIEPGE